MDILGAAESKIKSILDQSAFDINVCVKDQSKDGAIDKLMSAIKTYQMASSQLEIIKNLRSQVNYSNNNTDNENQKVE